MSLNFQVRKMDVLVKLDKTPASLKRLALGRVCHLLLRFLHRSQLRNLLRSIERPLQNWTSNGLPVTVRQELIPLLISRLNSTFGPNEVGKDSSNVSLLMASVIEILFSPHFKSFTLPRALHWHKESRTRVLHLLHQTDNLLESINFDCYGAPIFKLDTVHFSEKFILTNCFYRLRQLQILLLPHVCDDEMLAYIGSNCPNLKDIDVRDSFGVTNQGLRWFCGVEKPPARHVQFSTHDPKFRQNLDIRRRPGFQATPFAKCHEDKQLIDLQKLRKVNFCGTGINEHGLETILHKLKMLTSIEVDDNLWNLLLRSMDEEDGNGCLDCIGGHDLVTSINMVTGMARFMGQLVYVFPNLSHVTLNNVKNEDMGLDFEDWTNLTALTIKDTNFDPLKKIIPKSIRTLLFAGAQRVIDISDLSESCPNLSTLGITYSRITKSEDSVLENLTILKLWDIQCDNKLWLNIVSDSTKLEKIFLWNLVVCDADLDLILAKNPLSNLRDIRIGSSEIGYLKLTESAVLKMIKRCPKLNYIGGICDWNIHDLVSLLQDLLISGGWKISLENETEFLKFDLY